MNTASINFQAFVDWDNSPFILFDHKGKIVYLNHSAEVLLGYVSVKELYTLALTHAPHTFGFKTTGITLDFEAFSFYAITVGYENEEYLALRLYNLPRIKQVTRKEKDKFVTTDLNLLIEAAITLFRSRCTKHIEWMTDPDLPQFRIDQNRFSKLLRKIFDGYCDSDKLTVTLKLLIGEHAVINDKKVPVAQLSFRADTRNEEYDVTLREMAESTYVDIAISAESVKLHIPMID